ncbi:EC1118_1P2_4995p [Saccharomyces cerevisiae EC1118]|uniref:Uncharacterized protein YPR160W-A n=2 Tax=Saccharomyces cerevisiae TaxID=4932 RepID=YP60A_YEAST|nr:RecName: Full=Uncharacterized protein YPR160W-A [Saccharomyces cerevisiae S288C]CAY87116.1 EC1118_1P2_4995p [Saccharomyces cerevisiae EC1118]
MVYVMSMVSLLKRLLTVTRWKLQITG